ncbi:MAG: hypothetical protein Q8Q18_01010 [bacterium]|nr:hypothetical protein [bacterium]
MEIKDRVGLTTKQTLKQKFLLFLLFLLLIVTITIAGEFVSSFSPFVGFVLYASVLLTVNLSDALYSFYFRKISLLNPEEVLKEIKWVPLVIGLSMFSIFLIGSFLNIPLNHYNTQANQIVLLVGFVYVVKEFWLMFLAANTYKKMKQNLILSPKNYWAMLLEWAITAVIFLQALFAIALKLPSIDKYLSISFIVIVVLTGGFYLYKNHHFFNMENGL